MVEYLLTSSDFPINPDFNLKMDWRKISLETILISLKLICLSKQKYASPRQSQMFLKL